MISRLALISICWAWTGFANSDLGPSAKSHPDANPQPLPRAALTKDDPLIKELNSEEFIEWRDSNIMNDNGVVVRGLSLSGSAEHLLDPNLLRSSAKAVFLDHVRDFYKYHNGLRLQAEHQTFTLVTAPIDRVPSRKTEIIYRIATQGFDYAPENWKAIEEVARRVGALIAAWSPKSNPSLLFRLEQKDLVEEEGNKFRHTGYYFVDQKTGKVLEIEVRYSH